VDVGAVLQTQRTATMRMLREHTRLKAGTGKPDDLSWRLVLDSMLFHAEAEIRWLDHCETSLARYGPAAPADTKPAATKPADTKPADTKKRPAIKNPAARRAAQWHLPPPLRRSTAQCVR
jgi:hypothetical protein